MIRIGFGLDHLATLIPIRTNCLQGPPPSLFTGIVGLNVVRAFHLPHCAVSAATAVLTALEHGAMSPDVFLEGTL